MFLGSSSTRRSKLRPNWVAASRAASLLDCKAFLNRSIPKGCDVAGMCLPMASSGISSTHTNKIVTKTCPRNRYSRNGLLESEDAAKLSASRSMISADLEIQRRSCVCESARWPDSWAMTNISIAAA